MSEQERTSPESQDQAVEAGPAADARERRRKLVRMVGSGVPLILSLPTRASAQTISSAYRGAQNDSSNQPTLAVNSTDGWIRVAALRYANNAGGFAYEIGGVLYSESGAILASGNVTGPAVQVYVAVLFETNFISGTAGATEKGPWPKFSGAGQALHLSSWSSLSPTGTRGPTWVV